MTTTNHCKNTILSNKVQHILYKKGYSFLFDWEDYHRYKKLTKNAIFPAHEIAEMFIKESYQLSDYAEYEF